MFFRQFYLCRYLPDNIFQFYLHNFRREVHLRVDRIRGFLLRIRIDTYLIRNFWRELHLRINRTREVLLYITIDIYLLIVTDNIFQFYSQLSKRNTRVKSIVLEDLNRPNSDIEPFESQPKISSSYLRTVMTVTVTEPRHSRFY